jgi:pimeloyl-ACP methyl ester carboxylesterase
MSEPRTQAGQSPPRPATFVLVHGAWHGGWCYARTAALLRARGHQVYTPTLSGLADRAHLFSGAITLSTHIADIVNLIKWEDLNDVVLCGHSYGGMVISGVAEQVSECIASLVFLDAFIPEAGDCLFDIVPLPVADFLADAGANGGVGITPLSAALFAVNEGDRARVDALCTLQPIGTFTEKLPSVAGRERIASKHYIFASGYADGGLFKGFHARVAQDPGWTTAVVDCGHDVMLDQPERLAELFEAAVPAEA